MQESLTHEGHGAAVLAFAILVGVPLAICLTCLDSKKEVAPTSKPPSMLQLCAQQGALDS